MTLAYSPPPSSPSPMTMMSPTPLHQQQAPSSSPPIHSHSHSHSHSPELTAITSSITSSMSIESTYTSLIQQYLSLLQYDNATFIAERFVSYNSSPYSNYLLAMCYYRCHKVQYAKRILTNWCQKNPHNNPSVYHLRGGSGHGNSNGKRAMQDLKLGSNPWSTFSRRSTMHMSTRFFDGRTTQNNPKIQNSQNQNRNPASTNTNDDENDEIIIAENIIYLLAKCCIDLELWKEAEDALLKTARVEYVQYKKRHKEELNKEKKNNVHNVHNGGNGNEKKMDGIGPIASSLEEYLLEFFNASTSTRTSENANNRTSTSTTTTTKNSGQNSNSAIINNNDNNCPCPIPNGAAGLHLMGIICQRTMRKEKAAIYYQLALKLDPMMWTSYEALCEMGIATIQLQSKISESNTVEELESESSLLLDPTSVFGVIPPNLLSIPKSQGGYGPEEIVSATSLGEGEVEGERKDTHDEYYDTIDTNTNKINRQYQHQHQHQYQQQGKSSLENEEFLRRLREVGDSPFHIMNASPIMTSTGVVDEEGRATSSSFVPQTPYAHTATGRTTGAVAGVGASSFFPQTDNSKASSAAGHLPSTALFATPGLTPIPHHQQPHQYLNYSSVKKDDDVFSRAKQVASRLYYEPSPELTPPSYYQNPLRKRLMTSSSNYPDATNANTPPPPTPTPPRSVHSSLKMTRRKQYRRRTDLLLSVDEGKQGDFGEQRLLFDGMQGGGGGGSGHSDEDMVGEEEEEEETLLLEEDEKMDRVQSKQTEDATSGGEQHKNNDEERGEGVGVGEEGIQHILELFCTLGAAQRMLCSYRCKEAIRIYRSLPNNQYNTGFVQHQVGRAYFEMADYPNAQRALETMQRVEPQRMKGLELLSTVFWHLKREVELSSLAQRAVDFDRMAPESWCVVGNCFSLQKEHETALAFFRRSIQCDPSFTYSYTLSGHEYASNEDFDQALACFRNAIRNDDRHYTAWYGLGAIYFRQDKYDLAEYHFKKALSINPQSSVLHCHLGMAQHENGRHEEALDTLACAFRVDPRNPQARYQRATIWISMDRPGEALKELEKVRDAAPREASVHFAMGKVLKRLGRPEEAMRCFLTALDLDPKDNNLIKAAIDRLDDPDVLEEDNPAF